MSVRDKIIKFLSKEDSSNVDKSHDSEVLYPVRYFDAQGNPLGSNLERLAASKNGTPIPTYQELETEAFGLSPWVYNIVHRIAESAANIELKLYNVNGEEVSPIMMKSPRYRELVKLLKKPQTETGNNTFDDLIYMMVASYLLTGNNLMMGLPFSDSGMRYNELITPRFSNCDPNESFGAKINSWNINYFNLHFTVDPKDVLHQYRPNITSDLHEGHSAMQTLTNIWNANNAINQNERYIHERKGANGILHSKSGRPMPPEERDKQQKELNDQVSTSQQTGRYTYLATELGFINLSSSFKELQADKSKLDQMRTIAAAYKYPSELLGDPVKTYNNVKEAKKDMFDYAILPPLDMVIKGINEWLIRGNYGLETVTLGYDREDIPELNLVEKDKTDNQNVKSEMVAKVQRDVTSGAITWENGFYNMVINMKYTDEEAISLLGPKPTQQQQEVEDES